jgi:CelD/BcsL family acetyltransferase involved in cellulose biosynthesis
MHVHVIHPSELGAVEIAAWHAMQRATPSLANPFLSPEFAIAVGRFRPESRVGVLSDGQSVMGFFPFEKRQFGVGVPISGWLSPCQGLVHAPGAEWDPRELLQHCRLTTWKFDNLIPAQKPFAPFHAYTDPAPVIDLSGGFEAYYATLRAKSPKFCRELERKARKLDREVGELNALNASQDLDVLRTLIAWKSDQYRNTDHVDRFGHAWIVNLLETLLATQTDYLSSELSVLYAGKEPVAAQLGLRAGPLVVGWFTGYDASYSSYSPGLIQLMRLAEGVAATGATMIHMGKGAQKYTQGIKTGDVFVSQGAVTSRSVLGTAHRARNAIARWALLSARQHPILHDIADTILRHSGLSSRTYGRVLAGGAGRMNSPSNSTTRKSSNERETGWNATGVKPSSCSTSIILVMRGCPV